MSCGTHFNVLHGGWVVQGRTTGFDFVLRDRTWEIGSVSDQKQIVTEELHTLNGTADLCTRRVSPAHRQTKL